MSRRFISIVFLIITSCSSSTIILAPKPDTVPAQIVLRPLALEVELTNEHRTAVYRVVLAALRNRGYLVAESAPAAPSVQSAQLPSAVITITSLRRDSVLAGHINRISGTIQILDLDGRPIAEGTHTEVEKGGLLFNTGQLFKGIQSELANIDNSGFDDWIERFAAALVQTLPKPAPVGIDTLTLTPAIEQVHITSSHTNHQVCFRSSTGQQALLRLQNNTFPMREINATGRYCVALQPRHFSAPNATIIIESPLGIRSSAVITIAEQNNACTGLEVIGSVKGDTLSFTVDCGSETQLCAPGGPCRDYAFRLYELQSNGAFQLTDEFDMRGLTRQHTTTTAPDRELFRIFQHNPREQFSTPASLSFNAPPGEPL